MKLIWTVTLGDFMEQKQCTVDARPTIIVEEDLAYEWQPLFIKFTNLDQEEQNNIRNWIYNPENKHIQLKMEIQDLTVVNDERLLKVVESWEGNVIAEEYKIERLKHHLITTIKLQPINLKYT